MKLTRVIFNLQLHRCFPTLSVNLRQYELRYCEKQALTETERRTQKRKLFETESI